MSWFVTAEAVPDYKAEVGLASAPAARLLRSDTDAAACHGLNVVFTQAIAEEFEGQKLNDLVYYDIGGHYVAVLTFRTLVGSGFAQIGLEEVYTLDRSFTHLGGISF